MTGILSVTITTASRDEAEKIGRSLVEENLAACVNILPGVTSLYRWQGRLEEAEEVLLLVKTTETCFEALCLRVKALHSYECPCILSSPIAAGDVGYIAWVKQQVSGKEQ